jgi:hypothetical protein
MKVFSPEQLFDACDVMLIHTLGYKRRENVFCAVEGFWLADGEGHDISP